MTDAPKSFAAQLAANDREHEEMLERLAARLDRFSVEMDGLAPDVRARLAEKMLRAASKAIRDEIARWRRPKPLEGTKP